MVAILRSAEVISQLEQNKRSTACRELCNLFESLGFEVRSAKSPNHKIVGHQHIASFTSTSFSCEHGHENKAVKMQYVSKAIRVIRKYQNEIDEYLKGVEGGEEKEITTNLNTLPRGGYEDD